MSPLKATFSFPASTVSKSAAFTEFAKKKLVISTNKVFNNLFISTSLNKFILKNVSAIYNLILYI